MGLTLNAAAVALATGLYLSYIPVKLFGIKKWTGAGFIGTLEGLILFPILPEKAPVFFVVLASAIVLSCWLCGRAEKALGHHDDPRIILDEIVGYWTAVAFLPRTPYVLAAGFILFRFFDVVKLAPYRRLERLPGGWGIVADDVGAGIAANILARGLIFYAPWLGLGTTV